MSGEYIPIAVGHRTTRFFMKSASRALFFKSAISLRERQPGARACACAPAVGMIPPGCAVRYTCAGMLCMFTVGLGLGWQRV